jgi:predicted DNA-binding transcriptional regulator AlpA
MPRKIDYQNVLQPNIEYLEKCEILMIDTAMMAEFLGVSKTTMIWLSSTDRVPRPFYLGDSLRWNVFSLLKWVESGCPRRYFG